MVPKTLSAIAAVALLASALAARAAVQDTGGTLPPLVIKSLAGADLFDFYCASCHGRTGKGDGPVASAMKTPPPDLTTIAKRSGGAFPTARMVLIVSGGASLPTPAHGSLEMPVWGPIFRSLDPNDKAVSVRIANVVAYVQSLQGK